MIASRTRAILALLLPGLLALPPRAPAQDAVAYRGALLETIGPAGRIESGTLVVRHGKIEAVGAASSVTIPDDARIVDASGRTILPGLVEPFFDLPAPGAPDDSGGRTVVIGGRTIRLPSGGPTRTPSFTRMIDVFDPYAAELAPYLRSGLTHLNLASRGGFGQAAVLRIQPQARESQILEPQGVLYLSLSNSPASLDLLRQGLRNAKRGGSGSNPGGTSSGAAGPSSGTPSGNTPSSSNAPGDSSASSSSANNANALFQNVLAGKSPLVVEATSAAAILYLLDILKDEKDVKLVVLAAGADVFQTLDVLKARKPTIVLQPELDLIPNSTNRLNVARRVVEAGLDLAFTPTADRSTLRELQDTPLFPIQRLVLTGLPRASALAALTLVPARVIGQEKNLGTLEAGKSASFLVFEGDPLDPASRLRQVVIEGTSVYEN